MAYRYPSQPADPAAPAPAPSYGAPPPSGYAPYSAPAGGYAPAAPGPAGYAQQHYAAQPQYYAQPAQPAPAPAAYYPPPPSAAPPAAAPSLPHSTPLPVRPSFPAYAPQQQPQQPFAQPPQNQPAYDAPYSQPYAAAAAPPAYPPNYAAPPATSYPPSFPPASSAPYPPAQSAFQPAYPVAPPGPSFPTQPAPYAPPPPQMDGDGPLDMSGLSLHGPGPHGYPPQPQPQAQQHGLAPPQPHVPQPWSGNAQHMPPHQQQAAAPPPPSQYPGVPQQPAGPLIPPWAKLPHPKYMSLTCGVMPNSSQLRQRAQVPLGVILRPLSDPPSSSPAGLSLIDPSTTGVVRCRDCRAYINPFVTFLDGGARWRCNLCGLHNDLPSPYFSPLDATGRRADIADRPELTQGSIEIIAPADYMVRQPMPPVYVFVIDVSIAAVQSGMIETFANTVRECLAQLPGDKRTMIGFITFDSTVHFYTLKPGSSPQMLVITDLDDIFLPAPNDLLVNLDESRAQVEQLLTSLPSMFAQQRDVESALGPALEGALQMMSKIGGKISIFLSGLPSLGQGRLVNRENTRILGTEQENSVLGPALEHYKKSAIQFTKYQISCDMYVFACDNQYMDIATLSDLPRLTGGQLLYYPSYSPAQSAKFAKELNRCLTRTQGWEAVVRIRASKGVKITEYHGNFYMRGSDLLALPSIDADKAFTFELKNDDNIPVLTTPTISIQAALLYTTSSGERRIRVHTTCVLVSAVFGEIYERLNVNAITNLLAKQAVLTVYKEGFEKAREYVRNKCVALLRTHRGAVAKQMAAPSNELNVLPLMTLGLLKNIAFKEGSDIRSDVRSYILSCLYTMGIVEMETLVRPRMLPLHDLKEGLGLAKEGDKKEGSPQQPVTIMNLPSEASLTAEVLKPDTVFLIDTGFDFYLRIGKAVPSEWLQSVFGVPSLEGVDAKSLNIQTPADNDQSSIGRRVWNIINYLRAVSSLYQTLYIIKEGDMNEIKFFNHLIEDRNMSAMSLQEFDQFIHRAGGY